jgi:hypothetical protein
MMPFSNKALSVPAAAPIVVLTAARAATEPLASVGNNKAEPELNPYQQNHKIMVPNICKAME